MYGWEGRGWGLIRLIRRGLKIERGLNSGNMVYNKPTGPRLIIMATNVSYSFQALKGNGGGWVNRDVKILIATVRPPFSCLWHLHTCVLKCKTLKV